jgi:superfamily I DNA/RNA helicase
VLDHRVVTTSGPVSIATMHLAKGLEFRAVAVMARDDEVVPLQSRIESVIADADLKDVYDTERHLLYVACTRARDHLMVTSTDPGSEFLRLAHRRRSWRHDLDATVRQFCTVTLILRWFPSARSAGPRLRTTRS